MFRALIAACAFAVLLSAMPAVGAQSRQKQEDDLNSRLQSLISSGLFLTISCDVPVIQPLAPYLKRKTAPNEDKLVASFFGSRQGVTGEEQIKNALWGKGRRLKTTVGAPTINAGPEANPKEQKTPKAKDENVPVFLDIFPWGFIYANNVPHKPVMVADVKMENGAPKNVGSHNVYSEKEGQKAAEAVVAQMLGKLSVPKGFQSSVKSSIRSSGERLYAYRVNPEYITSYEYVGADKKKSKQSVAIPVYDDYVLVVLDADKQLAGIEYFWDGALTQLGTPQQVIGAVEAVDAARAGLPKLYGGQPPPLTISQIRLGFVQDRKDPARLVPAWLFDAWYTQFGEEQPKANPNFSGRQATQVAKPFAVNALTGDVFLL